MSFEVVGKRFYCAGNWVTVNLRSCELNSNVSVGFRLEAKAEEPLERQVERRAREILQSAIRAIEPNAAPEHGAAKDGGAIARRRAAEQNVAEPPQAQGEMRVAGERVERPDIRRLAS